MQFIKKSFIKSQSNSDFIDVTKNYKYFPESKSLGIQIFNMYNQKFVKKFLVNDSRDLFTNRM